MFIIMYDGRPSEAESHHYDTAEAAWARIASVEDSVWKQLATVAELTPVENPKPPTPFTDRLVAFLRELEKEGADLFISVSDDVAHLFVLSENRKIRSAGSAFIVAESD